MIIDKEGGGLHSRRQVDDDSANALLGLMSRAGFADAKKVDRGAILFGLLRVDYY